MNIQIPTGEKLIALAIDIWRLEEKIDNISSIDTTEKQKTDQSFSRLKRFINDCNIDITSYTGEKYSEEVNVYELKGVEETDLHELDGIIKDTIEPAVFIDGELVKTGKIIVFKTNS